MDLSFLKWPVIIAVVGGVIWLLSEGGVNYMEKRFTAEPPGQDAAIDKVNEAGLSRLAGYLMFTFRYERANRIMQTCAERYPEGENYWHNLFRRARLHERMADATTDPVKVEMHYQAALEILRHLMDVNAHDQDERVPEFDVLRLRAEKIAEVNELGEVGQF
jgi:hypothetical protein